MRITNQYVWNFFFAVLFVLLVFLGIYALEQYAYRPLYSVTLPDIALIVLATWRFTRLVVYDKIMAFFREQFLNAETFEGEVILLKPERGPRRTLIELLTCPWCFGMWAAAFVTFCYFITPYAFYIVLILAIAAVASFFQLLSNLVGWKAEELKQKVEK